MTSPFNRFFTTLALGGLGMALCTSQARAIYSEVSIGGSYTYGSGSAFASFSGVTVKSGAGFFDIPGLPLGTPVTVSSPFTFEPYSGNAVLSFSDAAARTYSIHLDSIIRSLPLGPFTHGNPLLLSGDSSIAGSGVVAASFLDSWILTIQSGSGTTFSASFYFDDLQRPNSVPDLGTTLFLLSGSLLGLTLLRRTFAPA